MTDRGQRLLLALLAGAAPLAAQQPALRPPTAADLEGVWRVVAFEESAGPGRMLGIPGAPPEGVIIYTATRHFSVQINAFFLEWTGATPTTAAADRGRVLVPQIAYFGTYSVSARGDAVIHHVRGDVSGQLVGTDQDRPMQIRGDSLVLGDGRTWRRVFVRVRRE